MVSPPPTLLVVGLGSVGRLAAELARAHGWRVLGLRRGDGPVPSGVVGLRGDGSDDEVHRAIRRRYDRVDAVLLSANPGLRGAGPGNDLARVAAALLRHWPQARLVYTGSSGVYADSGGRLVDEGGVLAATPRARGLLAIERAVLAHPRALVLRAGALAGIERARRSQRLRGGSMRIRGPMTRPLSWIHETDLCEIAVDHLIGPRPVVGVRNATAPWWPSVAGFHRRSAAELGIPLRLDDDDRPAPERRVEAPAYRDRPMRAWWV